MVQLKTTAKIAAAGALGLYMIVTLSAAPERSFSDADKIARVFLSRAFPKQKPVLIGKLRGGASHGPWWDVRYNLGFSGGSCHIEDSRKTVNRFDCSTGGYLASGESPRPSGSAMSQDAGVNALRRMWSQLGYKYPSQVDHFEFTLDSQERMYRRRGSCRCEFKVTEKGYPFVDRVASVYLEIDPYDGSLSRFSEDLDHPPTGNPTAKINRRDAFARVRLPRNEFQEDWHGLLGWYLPKGESTCRLGWRFQKLPGTTRYLVDAVSGAPATEAMSSAGATMRSLDILGTIKA